MEKIKTFYRNFLHNNLVFSFVLAFIVYTIMETLARHSLFATFEFLFDSPAVFIFNTFIIFATYAITLLFRRRVFWYVVISALWLVLGTINGIILLNRMTPFTTKDLSNLGDGLSIVTNYFNTFTLVLVIVGAVAIIGGLVVLFIFAPKLQTKVNYKNSVAIILIIAVTMFGMTQLVVKTRTVSTFFGNLAYAYRDYGVPYCFISTWVNTGIKKPDNYSSKAVKSIFQKGELGKDNKYERQSVRDGKRHPNIIFLQLESFIDPKLIEGFEYSKDPIPNFRKLMKDYSSGYITVPSVGAGTANTEFESMTGMSAKFFGPGEYPYKGILLKETFESIPYDLKDIGYSTHAIHNHRGAFYGRNKVFPNLGYDTFTSLEYMDSVERTQKNWAKDKILTNQIMTTLNASENEDYIYTISVQGHGKYPTEQVLESPEIKVMTAPTEQQKWAYEYYVNQVYDMDRFIKNLTDTLASFDEDTVLVMYGDHLPALDMKEEQMKDGDLFKTQYVIWDNFGKLARKEENLHTYQIGAEVLDRLDIHNGLLVKYHQKYKGTKDYTKNLKLLGYDMLYGDRFVYGKTNPFQPSDMRMGVKDIKVEKIVQIGDNYYIKGKNFTQYSKISLDGKVLNTTFLGSEILALNEEVDPADASRMKISQVEKNKEILSTTE